MSANKETAAVAFDNISAREFGLRILTAETAGYTVPARSAMFNNSGLCIRVNGVYWKLGLLGADRVAMLGGRCVQLDDQRLIDLTKAWHTNAT